MNDEHPNDRVRRSLAAHLRGFQSWGVNRGVVERTRRGARLDATPGATDLDVTDLSVAGPTPPGPGEKTPPGRARRAAAPDDAIQDAERRLRECGAEVAACTACRLHEKRTQTVFGVGRSTAELMFVGEGPGADEDRQGEPFVGRAGQLLDKIIVAMGLRREDVYIANVVKCRPPGNRTPTLEEVASCAPFLDRQIGAIHPRMIVALGRPASNFLLGCDTPVGILRGRRHSYKGIPVVVTYHPAYLLRDASAKKDTWLDLQVVIETLGLDPASPRRRG